LASGSVERGTVGAPGERKPSNKIPDWRSDAVYASRYLLDKSARFRHSGRVAAGPRLNWNLTMHEPPPPLEPPPAGSPQSTTSLAARLMNVLAAPGEVFDEVKTNTAVTSNWLIPAVLLVLVSWLAAWLIFSQPALQHQVNEIAEKSIQKQLEKSHLSGDEAERARQKGTEYASMATKIGAFAAPVFMGILIPVWWGLIVWLVGTRVLKGHFPFIKAVEVAGLANMIGVLEAVVKTLLVLVTGNIFASPSLALLVKEFDPQNPVHSLLAQGNVMTFWFLAAIGIGLGRLCTVSFGRAIMWVVGIWAAYTGLRIGFAFAVQAVFSK